LVAETTSLGYQLQEADMILLLPHQSAKQWIGHGCHAAWLLGAFARLTNMPMGMAGTS
jgi:hypothetical protein